MRKLAQKQLNDLPKIKLQVNNIAGIQTHANLETKTGAFFSEKTLEGLTW